MRWIFLLMGLLASTVCLGQRDNRLFPARTSESESKSEAPRLTFEDFDEVEAGPMFKKPDSLHRVPLDSLEAVDMEDNRVGRIPPRGVYEDEMPHVSLLLPLSGTGGMDGYLDFYQGFLLGVKRLKERSSMSVRVDLYDTRRDTTRVAEITRDPDFQDTNLVIGPVFESSLPPVLAWAEPRRVAVVSPLATLTTTRSDMLFQMAPPANTKYYKFDSLLDEADVTLIYGARNDTEFEHEILALVQQPLRIDYRFGSSSSNAAINALVLRTRPQVAVILSSDKTEVERILSALASARANFSARGRQLHPFAVLGNTDWNRPAWGEMNRTLLFKNHVVFPSSYHAKRDSALIRELDSDYIRAYGQLPTPFSYRGYDAAMIFLPALYNGFYLRDAITPLQTTYHFVNDLFNTMNGIWMRVEYNPDFTITVQ